MSVNPARRQRDDRGMTGGNQTSGASDLARAMGPTALEILGEPDAKHGAEWRYGNRGSLCVRVDKGTWYDHEAGGGGGVLDLIYVRKGLKKSEALQWLRERGRLPSEKPVKAILATYNYVDPKGKLVFQVVRHEPKDFRQRRPDGEGGWIWNTANVAPLIYRLPEVLAAVRDGRTVHVAEGEKAVDALVKLGVVATCSPGGANKWKHEHTAFFAGADVVILPDNDEPGRSHAKRVVESLMGPHGQVRRARVLALPELPEKGDPFDWIAAGGTAEQLALLTEGVPDHRRDGLTESGQQTPNAPGPGEKTIEVISEGAVADAFVEANQHRLQYDHTSGWWYLWDETRWRREEKRLAYRWAHEQARNLADVTENARSIIAAGRAAFAAGVERLAQSHPLIAVMHKIWDPDPWLLGTPNGVVDLRTGGTRPAEPKYHITKSTSVVPARGAGCPLWLKFLDELTLGDKELQRFLWQMTGYWLTGDTSEHALFFIHGPGGNGKSVFLNVIMGILADYAKAAAMDTFMASHGDRHPTELAMLAGARVVSVSETEEGRAWAENRIKQMTGGDMISARFMRQDFFEYRPQFKLAFISNHKPVLRNVDDAARRRFNIIPFVHRPSNPDKDLESRLRAEWPAILHWMIEGCLDWLEHGLIRPAVIQNATDEYFSEQDLVKQWMEERCDLGKRNCSDTTANLFKSWSDYAVSNGEKPGTTKWFAQILLREGFEPTREVVGHRGKRGFLGIQVKLVDTSVQWSNQYGQ